MAYNPDEPRDGVGRWSRMGGQAKAKLTSSARFNTKFTGPSKNSKGKATGLEARTVRTGFSTYEPSRHAVAIQTAKALDKDFFRAKDKAAGAHIDAAIANSQVKVTSVPAGVKSIKRSGGSSGGKPSGGKKKRIHSWNTFR